MLSVQLITPSNCSQIAFISFIVYQQKYLSIPKKIFTVVSAALAINKQKIVR
ncbi:hypothetical protein AEST_28750 [Alishewanella aestuarii B11]|uniref:Uncharacterized protein n=1 Tax=Alishewanella aestuarii B11 TaxID=1197174 RepID=J2ICG7_9ALTE|nr:hypothetical protein AEST_28750 [Alishewanella aestuarii B11]